MKKKIFIVSFVVILMLVAISFASAINTNNPDIARKESPLFSIRTRRAINEKITDIIENIRTNLFGERIFPRLPILNPPFRNYDQTPSTTSKCGYCRTIEPGKFGCQR